VVSHRIFKLRESSLNQPVDSEAFELAGLGLEYGDRVADEIERQLQVYDGEKLVPAEEFKLDVTRLLERSRKVSAGPPPKKSWQAHLLTRRVGCGSVL